jgi:hypothetical protein
MPDLPDVEASLMGTGPGKKIPGCKGLSGPCGWAHLHTTPAPGTCIERNEIANRVRLSLIASHFSRYEQSRFIRKVYMKWCSQDMKKFGIRDCCNEAKAYECVAPPEIGIQGDRRI